MLTRKGTIFLLDVEVKKDEAPLLSLNTIKAMAFAGLWCLWWYFLVAGGYKLRTGGTVNIVWNTGERNIWCMFVFIKWILQRKQDKKNKDCQPCMSNNIGSCGWVFWFKLWHKQFTLLQMLAVSRMQWSSPGSASDENNDSFLYYISMKFVTL